MNAIVEHMQMCFGSEIIGRIINSFEIPFFLQFFRKLGLRNFLHLMWILAKLRKEELDPIFKGFQYFTIHSLYCGTRGKIGENTTENRILALIKEDPDPRPKKSYDPNP